MYLTQEEQAMLAGEFGPAVKKSMQILTALGKIYGAERMVPVSSMQIAGVSYDNLGDAGLEFLRSMAEGGGKARVLTTLNPAGMDVENWRAMGIPEEFARRQVEVIEAFARMGVTTTCTCTPYLIGNKPGVGEHIAWAESSAVCYANSVVGARTNREGGPSALAAALTGRTPAYGLHLDEKRIPGVRVEVEAILSEAVEFGALGIVTGRRIEAEANKPIVYFTGIEEPGLENLKALSASLATYGGAAMFHMEGVTPEAEQHRMPGKFWKFSRAEIDAALKEMETASSEEIDFVSLGCPHLTIEEVKRIAELLDGRKVTKTFWITTSRPVKKLADEMGFTRLIEEAGATFAVDTCCVVAPIKGRFRALSTDSAKACYYAASKNRFKTKMLPFDQVIAEALK